MSPLARSALAAALVALPALATDARAAQPPAPDPAAAPPTAPAGDPAPPPAVDPPPPMAPAAQPGPVQPTPTPAPPPPAAPPPSEEQPEDAADSGPNWVIGIVGLAVGIVGLGTSIGLLAAAEEAKEDAADLRTQAKDEWNNQNLGDPNDPTSLEANGYREALPYYANICGNPGANDPIQSGPPTACSDLESAANDHAAFTAAGFFLLVGGSVLTIGSALYLAVGGGEPEEDDGATAVSVAPIMGPSQWGATMGGTF